MATATPFETLSLDTGPKEPERQIQPIGQQELPVEEIQAALIEEYISDTTQTMNPSSWKKWTHYVVSWVMLFSSFAVIIAGMTSRNEDGWGLAFMA
jgi:hypothetical protein